MILGKDTRRTIDFSDPDATRELTRCLLKEDFGLDWEVPLGMLVPPLTGRLNYILWIQDLLNLSSPPGRYFVLLYDSVGFE